MASLNATLTCPHCGHEAKEVMPTDRCIVVYDCPACARTLRPKAADCCVFAPTLIVRALPSKTQSPRTKPGSQSIAGAEEAAPARAVREQLGQLLKAHGIKRTRLFFYGPFALAVFLGQQLTAAGEIQLFEYQDPGYVPSCTLRT